MEERNQYVPDWIEMEAQYLARNEIEVIMFERS